MNCPKCGSPQQEDAVFCSVCGARLSDTPVGFQPSSAPVSAPVSWVYGSFCAKYVGIIVFGALFLFFVIFASVYSPLFTFPRNLANLFNQFIFWGTAALGIIVVGRTGGIDLSIAGLMPLSATFLAIFAAQGMPGLGIIVALVACLVVGLVNGVFTVFLRIPSILTTLVTLVLVRYLSMALLQGKTIPFRAEAPPWIFNILFVIALAGAFLLIFFTKLGKPFPQRDGRKPVLLNLMAYLFSAAMACLAGIMLAYRVKAASPVLGNGYELQLLLFLFIAGSSTLWDNKIIPVLISMVACIFVTIWSNVMSMIALDIYSQYIWLCLFLLLALALDRVYRRNIFPFKPLDSKA